MTTDERIENIERVLPGGKRRKRWLLAAVGLGTLAVVWSLGASMSNAEVAPSVQQQPGSDWSMLILLGIIAILVPGGCLLLRWRRRSRLHRLKTTINLKCPICGEVMSAPVVPPPLLHDGVKVGQTATCPSCGNVSLVGIESIGEGWLLFPTAFLVLSPLGNIGYLILAVTAPGLGVQFSYLVLLQIGFVMFQIWVAVVFLMGKPWAPKLVVALLLANVACAFIMREVVWRHGDLGQETGNYIERGASLLGSVVCGWTMRVTEGPLGDLEQNAGRDMEIAVVLAAVWITYFFLSRRVKATVTVHGLVAE